MYLGMNLILLSIIKRQRDDISVQQKNKFKF